MVCERRPEEILLLGKPDAYNYQALTRACYSMFSKSTCRVDKTIGVKPVEVRPWSKVTESEREEQPDADS